MQATIAPAPRPEELDFRVIAAEINPSGKVQIVQIAFNPRIEKTGPFDLGTPFYEMSFTTTPVEHFTALSAGLDKVARAILDGTVETQDAHILKYYRFRDAGRLDDLTTDDLNGLAAAILTQTKIIEKFVGGPDQIGVFANDSRVKWTLPELPTDRQKLVSTMLHLGFTYTRDGLLTAEEYLKARGKNMITNMHLSLFQPLEQPLTQVFVGSQFRDVSVSLDGNAFAGNQFSKVTFKYQGGLFFFPRNNRIDSCILELPPNTQVPLALTSCAVKQVDPIELDGTLGSPIRARLEGCVTLNAEGKQILKTVGWENGRNCKDSRLLVPFPPPLGSGETRMR
jgi:hypothetical protein